MLSLRQDALLLSLRPYESLKLLPRGTDRQAWLSIDQGLSDMMLARASQAMNTSAPSAAASDYRRYLENGAGTWRTAWISRRERLKALTLGACIQGGNRFTEAIADLLYAICEESDWALCQPKPDYPDFSHGMIDLSACETGALLAVVIYLLEDTLTALSPRIVSLVQHTLGSRLMEPLINQTPQTWMLSIEDAPKAAAALMTLTLTAERDDRRRWLALRWILKILDGYIRRCPQDGGFSRGLECHLQDVMALNDCFALLSAASGGEVELRDEALFVSMAESFLKCHIANGWFVNPGGISMRPALSPDLLFQLGESARVDALCGLASYLRRLMPNEVLPDLEIETPPILQQVMNALGRGDLLGHAMRVPRPQEVSLSSSCLLTGQMDDFFVSLTGPEGSPSPAGDISMFYKGRPLVISLPAAYSVPTVNGYVQIAGKGAQDAGQQSGPGWHMLGMNLTDAYPKEAGLTDWQRTWMMAPFEEGIRLMDVFDLDKPGKVTFHLILPEMPRTAAQSEVLLSGGQIRMRFDPSLVPLIEAIPVPDSLRSLWGERVWQLSLVTPDAISGGNYAFFFCPSGNAG